MEKKICNTCKQEKFIDEFHKLKISSDGHLGRCKLCQAEYSITHRQARVKKANSLRNSLKNVPCAMCGIRYPPYIMQFHHKVPLQKHRALSKITSIKQMKLEAEKCIILCANCHIEREWGENGSMRNYFKKKYHAANVGI